MGGSEVDVVVVPPGAKGLYALGMFSHEASVIAAKERAEMKMIEVFTAKLSSTALGIQSQSAVNRKAWLKRLPHDILAFRLRTSTRIRLSFS